MNDYKPDYIKYRLAKANEAFADAKLLAENKSWNPYINRLYYSCYYVVWALLLQKDISTHTHAGLKTQFNLHFIKNNIVEKDFGRLFSDLMDWRQKGDYGDMFDFTQESVEPLLIPVEQFLKRVTELIHSH